MMREPWQITREMFLSEDEVELLLARVAGRVHEADDDEITPCVDELIIHSLLFSGLRNSEFCRLTLADTVIGSGESMFLVRGTPREDRNVYIPAALAGLIGRYVSQTRPGCLPPGASPRDAALPLVFNERRKPYERTGLYRRVVRILTEGGLGSRASVQLLRHTYGYLAYKRSGGNLLFVQRQLGHAHPLVTSIYAQFVDEPYARLADAVGGHSTAKPSNKKSVPRKRITRVKGK
ncbi:MAG TPA: site-specific integrase [Planctomycetaceae bacterium]|jgi:integrase